MGIVLKMPPSLLYELSIVVLYRTHCTTLDLDSVGWLDCLYSGGLHHLTAHPLTSPHTTPLHAAQQNKRIEIVGFGCCIYC